MSAMSKSSALSSARDEKAALETATMGVQSEKHHFTCRIERVVDWRKCDNLIATQKYPFKMGDSIGLPTSWQFYFKRNSGSKSIGAYFHLSNKPKYVEDVYASYRVAIKKSEGGVFQSGKGHCENMRISDRGHIFFTSVDANLTEAIQGDGSLIVEVDFELFSGVRVNVAPQLEGKVKAFEVQSMEQLSKDMVKMLAMKDMEGNEATRVISKDNVEFPVCRGVLVARGEFFERMFQAEMSESLTGVVQLKDLSGKTVNVLLQYIFSGTLHQDWKSPDVIEELTSAAHRYELHLLTAFLDDTLGSLCTKDNAMRLAFLARTLGMKKAEAELLEFVKMNATSLEDLMVEPMKRTCDNCGEEAE